MCGLFSQHDHKLSLLAQFFSLAAGILMHKGNDIYRKGNCSLSKHFILYG